MDSKAINQASGMFDSLIDPSLLCQADLHQWQYRFTPYLPDHDEPNELALSDHEYPDPTVLDVPWQMEEILSRENFANLADFADFADFTDSMVFGKRQEHQFNFEPAQQLSLDWHQDVSSQLPQPNAAMVGLQDSHRPKAKQCSKSRSQDKAKAPSSKVQKKESADKRRLKARQSLPSFNLKKPMSETINPEPLLAEIKHYVNRSAEIRLSQVKNGKILRPSNAFLLYRRAFSNHAKELLEDKGHVNQHISKLCGLSWQLEPDIIKGLFSDFAKKEGSGHREAFPDWCFHPKKAVHTEREAAMVDDSELELYEPEKF